MEKTFLRPWPNETHPSRAFDLLTRLEIILNSRIDFKKKFLSNLSSLCLARYVTIRGILYASYEKCFCAEDADFADKVSFFI